MKKMFLLGDSISLHYGCYLAEYLTDIYKIESKPGLNQALNDIDNAVGGNGGDSSMVLAYLKERDAADDLDVTLFAFNCGLHDIKRKVPEEYYQVPLDAYEANLEEIYQILLRRGIQPMFILTTPVDEVKHCTEIPAGIKRYNADVDAYNEVAIRMAKKYEAPIIDLYTFSKNVKGEKYCDYAHFNVETRKKQAAFIAGAILSL